MGVQKSINDSLTTLARVVFVKDGGCIHAISGQYNFNLIFSTQIINGWSVVQRLSKIETGDANVNS